MRVHAYPPLLGGKLLRRYKRFFADIELDNGEVVVVHCANTGPMTGVSAIGSRVGISHQPNPKRKLPYSWEVVEVGTTWVGVNTSLPNRIIGQMLDRHLLPELEPYASVRSEVTYGTEGSRVDFLLADEAGARQIYVEVKNTTWSDGNIAIFPDTVTERGQKHLRELMRTLEGTSANGLQAVMLYFINRGDCDRFAPGDLVDPVYGNLLRQAIAAGIVVLPCRFQVTPEGVDYLGLAELYLP